MTHVQGGGVPEGTKLNETYELGSRIAMGGMGEVYNGTEIGTGRKVAIKMILAEHAGNELIIDLFKREATTLMDIYHDAIVRYFAFAVDQTLKRPFMVMEFAGGPALADRLSEKGPLSEDEMTVLRKRMAEGLHAAHRKGVVHRDISSDNIILVDDQVDDAKIIDFGIAKSASNEGTLIGSGFAGKLNYVSPEQLGLNGGDVSEKSDIYSLGLVFAEAAIGKPLPMGGTHVEVTDKRKEVPDLSTVPLYIRPLLEWMLQPDPADRPQDLQAVANWDPSAPDRTVVTPAAGSGGVHPREKLRQAQQGKDGKNGAPWLLIGLGGAVAAAAAVGAVVFLGSDQLPAPAGTDAGLPLVGASLKAPVQGAQAPVAQVGEAYDWSTPAFAYAGDKSALTITPRGTLPNGLIFQAQNDGTARISGTPTATGTYSIGVVAISPEEERASLSVQLTIDPERVIAAAPQTPTTLPSALSAPQTGAGDAGVSTGSSGSGASGQNGKLGAGASVPQQPALAAPQTGLSQPEVTQPQGSTGLPSNGSGGLSAPDTGSDSLHVATGSDQAPAQPSTGGSASLQSGGSLDASGSLATPPREADGEAGDNAGSSQEPTVNTTATAVLQQTQPSGDGGPALATGGDSGGGFQIPSTGVALGSPAQTTLDSGSPTIAQPATPAPSQPAASSSLVATPSGGSGGGDFSSVTAAASSQGDVAAPAAGSEGSTLLAPPNTTNSNPDVAALPTNSPPTIVSALTEPLGAARNVPIDSIIGTFFDEDGPEKLRLQINGFLPAGVSARLTSEGRVQLTGVPIEYGSFPLEIAAVDPDGAVSVPFVFTLNILETKDNLKAWKYIANYPGGDCSLSRPDVMTETSAIVEVFAAESAIERIYQLNDDFIRDMGFEADFNVRLITDDQCPLIHALDQVGPAALDNALVISLVRDELQGNDRLVGKLQGGDGAKLYLYDSQGGLHDLSRDLNTVGGETGFDIEMAGTGAQILIAAKPRPGSGVDVEAGIEFLLGAAQRGDASLALGYFTMQ